MLVKTLRYRTLKLRDECVDLVKAPNAAQNAIAEHTLHQPLATQKKKINAMELVVRHTFSSIKHFIEFAYLEIMETLRKAKKKKLQADLKLKKKIIKVNLVQKTIFRAANSTLHSQKLVSNVLNSGPVW